MTPREVAREIVELTNAWVKRGMRGPVIGRAYVIAALCEMLAEGELEIGRKRGGGMEWRAAKSKKRKSQNERTTV